MLTFLLAAAITYTLRDRDVLQPPKAPSLAVWTSQPSSKRQALQFTAKDGSQIRGWFYPAKLTGADEASRVPPTVLFFYGSNEDLVHEEARLVWLSEILHVNAICFDFPGYGFSTCRVSVTATREAALEEYDFVHDHLLPESAGSTAASSAIIAYGWSIGTGLAVHVAAERGVAGLMLQAPRPSR